MRLPVVGPSYTLQSIDVNNQQCMNMYYAQSGPGGYSQDALYPTPGKRVLVDLGDKEVRGLINVDDVIYAVAGRTIYKLDIDDNAETATGSSVGSITTSSSGPVSMARNPTQIMIVDGTPTGGYITTIASDSTAQISDADFTGGVQVAFVGSYFMFNTPNASTVYATAINDGSSIDALDFTTAQVEADKVVGLGVNNNELWVFGEDSVEVYYNAANPTGFPFSLRPGVSVDFGCGAAHSIVNVNDNLIWLDNRGYIVQSVGYKAQVIANEAVAAAIRSYDRVDDAVAFSHMTNGHLFYVISFPTAQKTWSYDLTTQQWHERGYWTINDEFEHDLAQVHTRYKQWDLVGDRQSGKIYILDPNHYKDGADLIHRVRRTSHIHEEFKDISLSNLELKMEVGKIDIASSDSDPQIMMRYSKDGGYTFSSEAWRSMGKTGEYGKRIRWTRLGSSREWLFEFRIVSPTSFALIDASVRASGGLT